MSTINPICRVFYAQQLSVISFYDINQDCNDLIFLICLLSRTTKEVIEISYLLNGVKNTTSKIEIVNWYF